MGMYDVRIAVKDTADGRELDKMELDLHRRAARKEAKNRFIVPGLLTSEQIEKVKRAGFEVTIVADVSNVAARRRAEVSQTNRFAKTLSAAAMLPQLFTGYLNVEEIETSLINLSKHHAAMATLIELPNPSWEKRVSHAVRLGAGDEKDRPGVLFTGSMHAREWGGSDICVSFINSLVNAYEKKSALQIGPRVYKPGEIKQIMEKIWIYVFPDVNPDGKQYSQSHDDPGDVDNQGTWWRKNRNPNGNSNPRHQGVDINRNFDFLWRSGLGTSADVSREIYKGPSPFSEPETRNVKHLFDSYPDIQYYVDIHSYSGLVLCAWGDDESQSTDPSQSFLNEAYDGKRGYKDGSAYGEYIPLSDDILSLGIAGRMNEALAAVGETAYIVQQGIELYPTTGTSSDYAYSRHMADPAKTKITAFTIEFGAKFIPEFSEMKQIIEQVNAAMTELCWIASRKAVLRRR
ncbi:MAG: carboxypeptidase [Desulfomonile tiedjei]|uniref:Carboxypeptidase n=1 Tax=Desulfomonile tiedjei TaxID=2358 RepID=A0A9D6Z590_9BACT|nr:carboxypeptidase [Desulfomonile tiedjei]